MSSVSARPESGGGESACKKIIMPKCNLEKIVPNILTMLDGFPQSSGTCSAVVHLKLQTIDKEQRNQHRKAQYDC